MEKLVFLLEEASMAEVLKSLLPKLLPGVECQLLPHEGKSDLDKSIPRKLRAYKSPGVRFVVVRDRDSADCVILKKKLVTLCSDAGRSDTLIRIPCPELESWFLGDLHAVELGCGRSGLLKLQDKKKYRDPDALGNASEEIKRLVPGYQKIGCARAIAPHFSIENNRSESFKIFVSGVRKIAL